MIIRLKPIPLRKVWGGDKLSKVYGFSLSNIGEVWGISAHKSNSNEILNGPFKGMTFRELFTNHKEYFGYYPKDEFPLLLKVIDAKSDLSVQVHPDDNYAFEHKDSYGKDEGWYILDADIDSSIQIGHKAKNRDEMVKALENNTIEKILNYYPVSIGDYYYISSGKVHAICKNTTLLEVSQSSDITYRLYDYDRLDNGKLRKLHIDSSLDVISYPDTEIRTQHDDKYFTFNVLDVSDETLQAHKYGDYIYIINGNGLIENEKVFKGDFLIITSNSKYEIQGNMKISIVRVAS